MKNLRAMSTYQDSPRSRMGAGAQSNIRNVPAINPDETFFHFDILRALEMHRGLALGIFISALVLSCAYMVRRWHTFKAESLVYVQPAPPKLLQNGQEQQWPYDANTYETYIQQQIHDVTRADVLAAAVQRIPDFQGTKESLQAAADRLDGNLKVDRVSTGYQISIEATAGSAEEAAEMANAVAGSFIQSATKELRSGDSQRLELLREERDRVQKELASDRTEQDTLNKQLGVASVGSTPDFYDEQIAAIRGELVKARTDNDEAAAKLTATAGGGPSSAALDAAADEIVAADPGLVSMKTALNKRRSDLISQMSNLKPDHPLYKQDAEELAKIQSSLDSMTKDLRAKASTQIEQRLKSDLERTSSVEGRLNAQLAQMTSAAGGATPRLQRESDLATDISRLQARYTTVDEQYRNLSLEVAAPGAVYLAAPATPPLHADRKKVYRNALIVLLGGIVFALGGALIALNLDPRIYISADVERVLGFAPMALLPDLYEVGTGVAEEYMLRLAAAVEHAHQQGNLHSCIFTGVAPGAGVTTVSTRVTSMLQAMGRETVLVDAVGAPQEDTEDPGSELVHIPRGSRSTALLQQMTAGAHDDTVVVTDAAPLLVSGETEYLARFVDSAILVIESGVTTKAQLREVARTLERLDVAAVGFVLNRISLSQANPAFRESVKAVEKHLKAQSKSFERQRVRTAPVTEEAPPEKRELRSSTLERLQTAVSEPSHLIEKPAGPDTRFQDRSQNEPGRQDGLPNPEVPTPPDAATTEHAQAADAEETPDSNSNVPAPDPVPHIHNSGKAENATMWQSENSAPTAAVPVQHSDDSASAYVAPSWLSESVSPLYKSESTAADKQKPTTAETSLEEVHMDPRRVENPFQSPWPEAEATSSAEDASPLWAATTAAGSPEANSRPSIHDMPDYLAQASSNRFEETPAEDSNQGNAPLPWNLHAPASTNGHGPSGNRELLSYLLKAQETIPQPRYEDFLKMTLEGVSPWEDGFARLQNATEREVSAPDQALSDRNISSPEYAPASSEYTASAPENSPNVPAENPDAQTARAAEVTETPVEGWKFGPSNPAGPARGRGGVHVILGAGPSAPLTGEEVPDVWRDLLRAEEEAAASAAQQEPEFWPPVPVGEEDTYALRRLAEEYYPTSTHPEPVHHSQPLAESPYSFESETAMAVPPQPLLEQPHPFQSVADLAETMQAPAEAVYAFQDHATAADSLPALAENPPSVTEPAASLQAQQVPEPVTQAEAFAWPVSDEISSQLQDPLAESNIGAPRPEPLKEWWEELTERASQKDEVEAQTQRADTPEVTPETDPDVQVNPEVGKQDEGLYRAASRLSGLRNLLVSLGIQNLHQGSEQRKAEARNDPPFERPLERPIYPQPSGSNGTSAEVTAPPQIIPPKFNPLTTVREKEPKTPVKSPPVNRWDSPDDVDILPARRGQYRRSL